MKKVQSVENHFLMNSISVQRIGLALPASLFGADGGSTGSENTLHDTIEAQCDSTEGGKVKGCNAGFSIYKRRL